MTFSRGPEVCRGTSCPHIWSLKINIRKWTLGTRHATSASHLGLLYGSGRQWWPAPKEHKDISMAHEGQARTVYAHFRKGCQIDGNHVEDSACPQIMGWCREFRGTLIVCVYIYIHMHAYVRTYISSCPVQCERPTWNNRPCPSWEIPMPPFHADKALSQHTLQDPKIFTPNRIQSS